MEIRDVTDGRQKRQIANKEKTIEIMLEFILKTGEMPEVEKVIEAAGISRRSFFRFFKSESIRISEICKMMMKRISNRFKFPSPDVERSLEDTLKLFLDVKIKIDEYRMPMRKLAEENKRSSPEIKGFLKDQRISWSKYLEDLFTPHLKDRRDKEALLQHIHFNSSWNVLDILRNDFNMSLEESSSFIKRQILAVLELRE